MTRSALSADDRAFYTEGGCHLFAVALARQTGWRVVALVDVGRAYDGGAFPVVAHLLAEDPTGRLWDALGIHRPDEVRAAYPDLLTPCLLGFDDPETVLRDWSGDSDARPLYAATETDMAEADAAVRQAFPALSAG